MSTGRKLIIFSDYTCPYCYLAHHAAGRLQQDRIVDVEAAAFELRPAGTPPLSLADPGIRRAWDQSVVPLARQMGVVLAYPEFAPRTRKAHEAVAWGREQGAGAGLHEAIFRAYWEDGRDIGRIDVLVELGVEAGADGPLLKVALDIDQWTERVERDEAWAGEIGVQGVPAHLLLADNAEGHAAGRLWVGLRRYDELRDWVTDTNDV